VNNPLLHSCALALAVCAAVPAHAQRQDLLVQLVNAYRASPGNCGGRAANPVPPLLAHPALSNLTITSGMMLDQLLERAGYPVARAEAISISGAADAQASTHLAGEWLLLLAQPAAPVIPRRRPNVESAGVQVLNAVNAARAQPRKCGAQDFGPAPPLTWNDNLALAAQTHSNDMATLRYFSHQGKDGRAVADRASHAGYRWRLVGENIAVGQDSTDEVVAGWLNSPGHCVNIMNPNFTQMGSAFAISGNPASGRVYWTQVLATPR
jgi:uncharacterized protein YkwD